MTARPLGTTQMILHAAARVLGCGSVQMMLADHERQALVFTTSIQNRELPRVREVESVLGFQLEGAALPFAVEGSLLVRALRHERLIVTADIAELAGGLLDEPTLEQIRGAIGPRTFAAVPFAARSGILGVLLFEKPGRTGFSAEDRDLLVAYADRVGVDLESQALSDDVQMLETLGPGVVRAPDLYACDPTLVVASGPHAGKLLWDALGVPKEPILGAINSASARDGAASVGVRAQDGRMLRLTLSPGPGTIVIAACEEIEEIDRLRREARRAREHLAKVLRSVADAILTLTIDGRIASGNDAVERALGWAAPSLHDRAVEELCADDRSRRRALQLREEVLRSGFAERELKLRKREGGALVAEVSALLLADDEERPAGMIWRVHDLTERRRGDAERKRLQARLLHTERLSALGEMAARIAHEVRNPLVSIGAAAQVVAEELGGGSPVAGEVGAIAREVKRLDGIVSDFLKFARPRRAELRQCDLAGVVDETAALVRAKAPETELVVNLERPLNARCDPDAIKQVLLNVLLNAVEAAPKSQPGAVIECDGQTVGAQLIMSVADRGPGIPDQVRRRVFDPFFSTKTRGTGLGLAVSKQIVDEHHGRIRLFNRRGGGTRVVIELPVG
ncbi:MAG TPA: ATP-binding protein [Polyangia bacterium]|jgi:PAS domain S-box-containing protein